MTEKIKILFIETGLNGGGSFESMYQIVKNIDRDRFEPIVLYVNYTGYFNKMSQLNVKTYLVKDILFSKILPKNMVRIVVRIGWFLGKYVPCFLPSYELVIHLRLILAIRRIVRDNRVNIVIPNNDILRHFFCVVGLRKINIPILSYLRSHITKGMNNIIAELGNKRVDRYIAYSEGIKDLWTSFGVDQKKVEIIHNGIDLKKYEPIEIWERMNLIPRNGPLVGAVGAIRPNRSFDFLIKSFAKVLIKEPEAFLIIIGSCYNKKLVNKLKSLVKSLGIVDSVRFHGPDKEARRMIGQLDVFCMPYRVEPFGRVLLESWAMETPVIATKVGKIEKIIEHNKNGILVNYGDEDALSNAIITIWRDKKIAKLLVEEGLKAVKQRFSIEVCTRKLEILCEEVVETYCRKFQKDCP